MAGAAIDGRGSCQEPLLTLPVEETASVVRLVELSCVGIVNLLGSLPPETTDDDEPGPCGSEFHQPARMVPGSHAVVFTTCEEMAPAQRRSAVSTALDTLVGHLAPSGGKSAGPA